MGAPTSARAAMARSSRTMIRNAPKKLMAVFTTAGRKVSTPLVTIPASPLMR